MLGSSENGRPLLLKPGEALRRVEMIRHKTGLLKRKPHIVQQCTDIMAIVEDAKLPPDQHADQDRVPTGRLTAHHQRTGLDQLHQAVFLAGRQLLWAPTTVSGDQAVQAAQEKGLLPVVETGYTEPPALAQHRHG